ncbi:site-specific integrase [Methylobacterium sp. WL116]|uniref:site-specific integrase n=1 Tax=Methylobacterium sp. WL116 TaxID=2603889 RepID=UPI001FEDE879|nr:site-specific integrase [Methylobacterium sp. WL116]
MTTRPWKHPKTAFYYLRRAVPLELRALVGKREEKVSLGTKDPVEAKRLHAIALVELEQRWAALRVGPRRLSEREAHELAAPFYDHWLGLYRDEPSRQTFWRIELGDKLWPPRRRGWSQRADLGAALIRDVKESVESGQSAMEEWCLQEATAHLKRRGLIVEDEDHFNLAKAIAAAVQRASLTLASYARGEFDRPIFGSPVATNQAVVPAQTPATRPSVTLDELVTGWAAERNPTEKTLYEWKRVLRGFATFTGSDDAGLVTPENVIAWKNDLVAAGLTPKTINDAKLAPVRTILQWGVSNRQLPANPAAGITISVKKKAGQGIRSFTEAEALTILQAAAGEIDPVRRWIPWLCAYSGARLSEVCQLRVEDIQEIDGVPTMRFDAEAGSLKTFGSERTVPLHRALIAAGFIEFVRAQGMGPLFSSLKPDKFGKRGGNGTKILGRWVRGLGISDKRLSPSHSWRHRFKTLARNHALAPDIADAITGHSHRSIGDNYGDYPIMAMERELQKIPALNIKLPVSIIYLQNTVP